MLFFHPRNADETALQIGDKRLESVEGIDPDKVALAAREASAALQDAGHLAVGERAHILIAERQLVVAQTRHRQFLSEDLHRHDGTVHLRTVALAEIPRLARREARPTDLQLIALDGVIDRLLNRRGHLADLLHRHPARARTVPVFGAHESLAFPSLEGVRPAGVEPLVHLVDDGAEIVVVHERELQPLADAGADLLERRGERPQLLVGLLHAVDILALALASAAHVASDGRQLVLDHRMEAFEQSLVARVALGRALEGPREERRGEESARAELDLAAGDARQRLLQVAVAGCRTVLAHDEAPFLGDADRAEEMRDEVARPGALERLALAVLLFEDRLREIGDDHAGGDIDHCELHDALRVLVRAEGDLVLVPHVVDLDDAAALETDARALDVRQTVHRRGHRALARRLEREGVGLEAVEVAEGPPLRRHAVRRIRTRPLRLGVESAVLAGEDLPPVAEAGAFSASIAALVWAT